MPNCLWGEDADKPLYVGKSENVLGRLGSHMSGEKRYRVHRVTLLRCAGDREMADAESRLILHYQPPLNVVGVFRAVPPDPDLVFEPDDAGVGGR